MHPSSSKLCVFVVAVDTEADAIRKAVADLDAHADLIVTGIGRTNAACATTEYVLGVGKEDCPPIVSIGIAGACPSSRLSVGDVVLGSTGTYMEEGIEMPEGWEDTSLGLHFDLGDFDGNEVPPDPNLLSKLANIGRTGVIATVATCSGTDALARSVEERTDAIAEAMEGAAVLHAALRLEVPAIEVRVISNTTGDRDDQIWDIDTALANLGEAALRVLELLRS